MGFHALLRARHSGFLTTSIGNRGIDHWGRLWQAGAPLLSLLATAFTVGMAALMWRRSAPAIASAVPATAAAQKAAEQMVVLVGGGARTCANRIRLEWPLGCILRHCDPGAVRMQMWYFRGTMEATEVLQ